MAVEYQLGDGFIKIQPHDTTTTRNDILGAWSSWNSPLSKVVKILASSKNWTRRESNSGPSACEADVLPLYHAPRGHIGCKKSIQDELKWRWKRVQDVGSCQADRDHGQDEEPQWTARTASKGCWKHTSWTMQRRNVALSSKVLIKRPSNWQQTL